jgi:uncharacterized protein (UPF0332 family)
MSFDWTDYLTLAKRLTDKADNDANLREAKYRDAISRAYYSAFGNACKQWQQDHPTSSIPQTNTHKFIINDYTKSAATERQKIGKRLRILRNHRNNADYVDIFPDKLAETAQKSLQLAEEIRVLIATL